MASQRARTAWSFLQEQGRGPLITCGELAIDVSTPLQVKGMQQSRRCSLPCREGPTKCGRTHFVQAKTLSRILTGKQCNIALVFFQVCTAVAFAILGEEGSLCFPPPPAFAPGRFSFSSESVSCSTAFTNLPDKRWWLCCKFYESHLECPVAFVLRDGTSQVGNFPTKNHILLLSPDLVYF